MDDEYSFQFRAGTCNFADGRVTPNNDKGVISLGITEDGLFHFLWTNRQTGSIDLDLIIFPDEAEFKIAGPPSSRVYVLKFKTTGQKNFFWLQDSNAQDDTELVERVNALLKDPTPPLSPVGANPEDDELVPMDLGADVQVETEAPHQRTVDPARLQELREIFAQATGQALEGRNDLKLTDVITPEAVMPLLQNASALEDLYQNLPEGAPHTPEEILDVVRSPQFAQSLQSLGSALRTGQLNPLLAQLGLPPVASVRGFLKAIVEQAARQKERSE